MASTIFQLILDSLTPGHAGHSGLNKSICTIPIHNNNVNAIIDVEVWTVLFIQTLMRSYK